MKNIYAIGISLLTVFSCMAQAPANYYNNATGSGYTLKTQLKTIISANHTPLTYTPGLWNLYSSSDADNAFRDKYYENDNSILDIYSEKPAAVDPYAYTPVSDQCGNYSKEGDCYNREHLIPQSYFDENAPMKTDAFHVWPTDGKVNNERGNLPFGTVANVNYTSLNGTKRGSSSVVGYTGTVVEPIDEFKGDIARVFFYFATRYEDYMDDFYQDNPNVDARVMFDGSTDKVFNSSFLDMLYEWHLNDPVSQRETDLNNFIYNHQGNRNPYIDNPLYVTAVWFPHLLGTHDAELVSFRIYPNPAKNHTVFVSTKETVNMLLIHTLDGKLIKKVSDPRFIDEVYRISDLKTGVYLLTLKSGEKAATQKFIIQ